MIASCVFAIIAGIAGHPGLSILICVLGAALCLAIIHKDPIA